MNIIRNPQVNYGYNNNSNQTPETDYDKKTALSLVLKIYNIIKYNNDKEKGLYLYWDDLLDPNVHTVSDIVKSFIVTGLKRYHISCREFPDKTGLVVYATRADLQDPNKVLPVIY